MLKIGFQSGRLVLLLLLGGGLVACGLLGIAGGPTPQRGPVTVTGNLQRLETRDTTAIQFRPFIVSANPGDTIRWLNRVGITIMLRFGDEVPVGVPNLTIRNGQAGEIVVDSLAAPGRYKYGVTVMISGDPMTIDPYIDIPPPPDE